MKKYNITIIILLISASFTVSQIEYNDYGEIIAQTISSGGSIQQKCMLYAEDYARVQTPCVGCSARLWVWDQDKTEIIGGEQMTSSGGGAFEYKLPNSQILMAGKTYTALFSCLSEDNIEGNMTGFVYVSAGVPSDSGTGGGWWPDWLDWLSNDNGTGWGDAFIYALKIFNPSYWAAQELGAWDGVFSFIGSVIGGIIMLKDIVLDAMGRIPGLFAFMIAFLQDPVKGTWDISRLSVDMVWKFVTNSLPYFLMFEFLACAIAFAKSGFNPEPIGFFHTMMILHRGAAKGFWEMLKLIMQGFYVVFDLTFPHLSHQLSQKVAFFWILLCLLRCLGSHKLGTTR